MIVPSAPPSRDARWPLRGRRRAGRAAGGDGAAARSCSRTGDGAGSVRRRSRIAARAAPSDGRDARRRASVRRAAPARRAGGGAGATAPAAHALAGDTRLLGVFAGARRRRLRAVPAGRPGAVLVRRGQEIAHGVTLDCGATRRRHDPRRGGETRASLLRGRTRAGTAAARRRASRRRGAPAPQRRARRARRRPDSAAPVCALNAELLSGHRRASPTAGPRCWRRARGRAWPCATTAASARCSA